MQLMIFDPILFVLHLRASFLNQRLMPPESITPGIQRQEARGRYGFFKKGNVAVSRPMHHPLDPGDNALRCHRYAPLRGEACDAGASRAAFPRRAWEREEWQERERIICLCREGDQAHHIEVVFRLQLDGGGVDQAHTGEEAPLIGQRLPAVLDLQGEMFRQCQAAQAEILG